MKKYIITSPMFAGQAEIVYSNNRLTLIDLSACEMDEMQVEAFKSRVPVFENKMTAAFGNTKVTVVAEDYIVTFEAFWLRYDVKYNKKRVEAIWNALSKTDQIAAYVGHHTYDKHLRRNTWKNKANPDTYLRNRMWENQWK